MDTLVDLAEIRRLIEIVERHGLEGLTIIDDDTEIEIAVELPAAVATPATAAPAPVTVIPATVVSAPEPEPAPSHLWQLKSPITGVFYRSPAPDQPSYVQVGDVVDEHDTVCLIEAMKIFNDIPAGVHGRLVRVIATNDQLVVTGEVLMEFEPLKDGDS